MPSACLVYLTFSHMPYMKRLCQEGQFLGGQEDCGGACLPFQTIAVQRQREGLIYCFPCIALPPMIPKWGR